MATLCLYSYSINIIFLLADQIIGLSGAWNCEEAAGGRAFQFNKNFVKKATKAEARSLRDSKTPPTSSQSR